MTDLLLYERPVRLNRFAHADLRFTPPTDFMFCRAVMAAPLMAVEFPTACRQYPIVFVQAPDGTLGAQAVLSLVADDNAFVDRQGRWTATYIPAAIRRYPFVLAEIVGNPADFDVAVDEASPCFSRDHGQALFSPEGEPELAAAAELPAETAAAELPADEHQAVGVMDGVDGPPKGLLGAFAETEPQPSGDVLLAAAEAADLAGDGPARPSRCRRR